MPRVSPIYDSFNAGELSPLMEGRAVGNVGEGKYKKGLRVCENFVPLVQGPVTRRSGTCFVTDTKENGVARVVRFEFSTTQAYVLEFGDGYIRFMRDHGVIITGDPDVFDAAFSAEFGNSNYEVASPYAAADLFELYFAQSADILYIAHPDYEPRKLSRTGHTSWTLTTIPFLDGPYLNTNNGTVTMTPSAATGTITITASAATFASTDVGRLVRMKHSSTWGYAAITAFTSATVVSASVESDFGGTGAVTDWRLGVWSETTGYPAVVTFHGDRQYWGGATQYPQRIDGSVVGDYENFQPSATGGTVADDDAVAFTLNSDDVNVLRWMMSTERGLAAGTVRGEWIIRASNLNEAITPTNIQAVQSTNVGSGRFVPVRVGKSVVFPQRYGRQLRDMLYVYADDGFRASDLNVLASTVLEGGIVDIAYQAQPQSIVWCVRADGQLVGLTFEPEQEVKAWHRHILGGSFSGGNAVVESAACIPRPDGGGDELWLLVKRTINGGTSRHIEYMDAFWSGERTQEDAVFVDCSFTYDGAATATITGLEHLEGETVQILADGAYHPDRTVASGTVTLNRTASVVHVGYGFNSNLETERIEAGAADGTAQGKTKRLHRLTMRFWDTLGGKAGPDASRLDPIIFRTASDPMTQSVPLYTGDKALANPSSYDTEGRIYLRQDQPFPMTVLAIMPQLSTSDR